MDGGRRRPAVHARVPASCGATAACAGCSSAARRRRPATAGGGSTARSSTSPRAARPSSALREREVVEAQLAEVRASRARILEAADRARREIERNLHDGAQQRFVSRRAAAAGLAGRRTRDLPDDARARSSHGVLDELRAGLAELRDLAHGLHPAVLSDRGLEHALSRPRRPRRGAGRAPRRAAGGAAARWRSRPPPTSPSARRSRTSPSTRSASRAWVSVEQRDGELDVEVGDDGVGGAAVGSGSGLQGLRDRVAAVNGTLEVDSRPAPARSCARGCRSQKGRIYVSAPALVLLEVWVFFNDTIPMVGEGLALG